MLLSEVLHSGQQAVVNGVEKSLRRHVPLANDHSDILIGDEERIVVRKLPGNGPVEGYE